MRLNLNSNTSRIDCSIKSATFARFAILMSIALVFCGCTTVQTSDLPPDELQQQIVAGQLVEPGDHVTVTTIQGSAYELEIWEVTEKSIRGAQDVPETQQKIDEIGDASVQTTQKSAMEIPIAEISAIQIRELTPAGKAAGATGAVVAAGGIMYFFYILLPALLVGALVGL